MTIESSPANNLFAGFDAQEKQMIAVAVRRFEELEETRRIVAGLSSQAQAIQSDLHARGVDDAHVLREAAQAVGATAGAQAGLAGEVQQYRQLFGPDGRAASAVGQYVQLLRNAHTGDINALNQVQAARRELYEARDASARHHGPGVQRAARQRGVTPQAHDPLALQPGAADLHMVQHAIVPTAGGTAGTGTGHDEPRGGHNRIVGQDPASALRVPRRHDRAAVTASLDIAAHLGWRGIRVEGDERFRRTVWREALLRGVEVDGYQPAQADERWAQQQRLARQRDAEPAAPEEVVRAFRNADTPAERAAATRDHPALKKAFAVEATYARLAQQIEPPSSRESFMNRVREHLAADLMRGREPADQHLLQNTPMKHREYSREQDRSQGR